MKIETITKMGLLVSLAFILSYIETLIPFNIGIPGVKLGLANLVVVIALQTMGYKEAFILGVVRVILVSITFGSMNSLIYSLAGSLLSIFFMVIMHKIHKFSIIGISIVGGLAHNIGQLIAASIILKTLDLRYYAGFLVICGLLTGLFIGLISSYVIKHVKNL